MKTAQKLSVQTPNINEEKSRQKFNHKNMISSGNPKSEQICFAIKNFRGINCQGYGELYPFALL